MGGRYDIALRGILVHNLEPQNAGLVDVKKVFYSGRPNEIFCARNSKKNKHRY